MSLPLPPADLLQPATECSSLRKLDLTRLQAAPARITSAVATTFRNVTVCFVQGYIAPQIQFELRLPLQGYSGRYLQTGCGGNCGSISTSLSPECDEVLAYSGGFAVATDNTGHIGSDTLWASGQEQLRIDFAYRSEHVMAIVGKAIVNAFYGAAPNHAYYSGCSNGGRQALQEAQHYPDDFDGLLAGAPAVQIAEAMERFAWESHVGLHADGSVVLSSAKASLLHQAVMSACDAADGLKDGEIADSRQCRFDPRILLCKGAEAPGCLTQEQVTVAQLLYQGPVDARGRALFTGGEPYGAELTWGEPGSFILRGKSISEEFVRFMAPQEKTTVRPGTEWAFDVAGLRQLQRAGDLYDAKSPDLRGLRDRGGKVMIWQGAADLAAGPYVALDYYQSVQNAMGGLAKTREFARFFLVPGVYHCRGGYVPYQEDMLGALVRWVEGGEAPESVIATAVLNDGKVRTRPVYAYPVKAVYLGQGDINKPENFKGVMPSTISSDLFDWVGKSGNK